MYIHKHNKLRFITTVITPVVIFKGNAFAAISGIDVSPLPHVSSDSSEVQIILNILFGLLGGIALLVITISGFRYIISAGEPAEVEKAKNAIIYAVIGLVVSILAFAIVDFVTGSL
jgi:hypothetical protein